jgi:tetratricopeptide (TPR) repeat protein
LQEKAVEELADLDPVGAHIYGLVSLASANRIGLFRDEIVFGTGDTSNTNLNAVDLLIRRNLLRVGHDGAVYTRHRLIAELVRDEIQRAGSARDLISGLAQIGASKVNPLMPRSARPWRILRAMISHDFLLRSVGVEVARNIYASLEEILNWDYHYWLQRGSLEVESGDLTLARNFLDQAKALSPDNPFVDTERAYLWFSQANADPLTETARGLAEEARVLLQELINRYGNEDPYPFHVLGSQGLAWARRALGSSHEKGQYLQSLMSAVRTGVERHPRADDLKRLLEDIKREHLEISLPAQPSLPM